MKSLLGNPVFQFILGRLIGGYMLFVGVTTRWTKVNRQAAEPFWEPDGSKVIGCIWHGRFALVHKMWAFGPTVPKAKMLISQSREGGIVAHTSRTVGAEVIRGSEAKNLYSSRDTHVFALTGIKSPQLDGVLLAYNNSSIAWNVWQFEPSLQYYRDRNRQGSTNQRWTPGVRVTYRGFERWALESALTYEIGKSSRVSPDPTDPTLNVTTRENSNRVNYSLGARYSVLTALAARPDAPR